MRTLICGSKLFLKNVIYQISLFILQKTYLNKKKVICQMNEMANIVDRMQNRMIENSMPTLYEVTKQKCIKYWVLLYTVGHSF